MSNNVTRADRQKDKRTEKCNVQFALSLEQEFYNRCERDGITPTPAALVFYLLQRRIIHERTPCVYMVFKLYPHKLDEADYVRPRALDLVTNDVPITQGRVRSIMSHHDPHRSNGELRLPEALKKKG